MTTTDKRFNPAERKRIILGAACKLAACGVPYHKLTRQEIAEAAGITGSAVQYHFSTMKKVRREVMRHAVAHQILAVIVQGLATADPHALKASDSLKKRALQSLLE